MKVLIVEDDFASRLLLQGYLQSTGVCHSAANGKEAVFAFESALNSGEPYDLICLDIMMPEMDGQETLREIRKIEDKKKIIPSDGVKVIMITALDDKSNVMGAFREQCDAYLVKPIERDKLMESLRSLELMP